MQHTESMPKKQNPEKSQDYNLWILYSRILLIAIAVITVVWQIDSITKGSFSNNIIPTIMLICIFWIYPSKTERVHQRIINYKTHLIRLSLSIIIGVLFLVSIPYSISTYIAENAKAPSIKMSSNIGGNLHIGTGYDYKLTFTVLNGKEVIVNNNKIMPIEGQYTFTGSLKEGTINGTVDIVAKNKHKSTSRKILITRERSEIEQAEYERLQQEKIALQKEEKLNNQKNEIKKLIEQVKNGSAKNYYRTIQDVGVDVLVLKSYVKNLNTFKNTETQDQEFKNLIKTFESEISKRQIRDFPRFRKAAAEIRKEILREHDVEVKTIGQDAKTLDLVGYYFAANRYIKLVHEERNETYRLLRFNRINYKRSRHGEYTYYTISSPKDGELTE